MLTLQEITSREEFTTLRPVWEELTLAGAVPTVFQSWPWLSAWLEQWGGGGSLRTLVFQRWREVVGIAPLLVRRAYGLPFRRLQWIGTGVSDYGDLLAQPGHEAEVARTFRAWLQSKAQRGWDVMDLHQLRADSVALRREPDAPLPAGMPARAGEGGVWPQAVAPYRPLPDTVEALHAQFGKKLRSNLRYALRTLERDHTVEFAQASEETLDDAMTAFFRLHALRWRSRWQPGVLFGKKTQAFHRRAARGLLEAEALRLHLLKLDGEIVSALYCFAHGGAGYYYLGGFDPDLSRYSVGTLLTAHALEVAVREGRREFDFLRGQESYKYRWDCLNRVNYRWTQPGRGAFGGCAPRFLQWEQTLADRYERRAHGGPAPAP